MIVTQDTLVKQIAAKADMNVAAVRKMFETAEELIFGCLSSTTPSEHTVIKLMDGLSLECRYIPEKKIHTYETIICRPKIWVKPKITRYYNRKLNGYSTSAFGSDSATAPTSQNKLYSSQKPAHTIQKGL